MILDENNYFVSNLGSDSYFVKDNKREKIENLGHIMDIQHVSSKTSK